MSRRSAVVAWTALVATAAAGCGIPPEPEARVVQRPPGPYEVAQSQPPAASPSGAVIEQLFFVRESMLVPVERQVARPPTVAALMADLLAGATDVEQRQGFTSALPGANVIGDVTVQDGVATVNLGPGLEGSGRNDAVLAFGQVVCTLDARPDINGVRFQEDGRPIGVPNGDSALSYDILTTADYTGRLAPR